jgi:hypothetical protein|tara:strand:- start:36546 stop:36962 length:417 start_codon:yes stop_codon:yes gene_type:complete
MNNEVKSKQCHDEDCDIVFKPFKTTDKFCSYGCAKKNQKPRKRTEMKQRKRIPVMSERRKKENAIYLKKRIEFLNKPENKICPVFPNSSTTEVHHMKGRTGSNYLDEQFWLAVSRKGHQKIEKNPNWAKEKGFSLSRL